MDVTCDLVFGVAVVLAATFGALWAEEREYTRQLRAVIDRQSAALDAYRAARHDDPADAWKGDPDDDDDLDDI